MGEPLLPIWSTMGIRTYNLKSDTFTCSHQANPQSLRLPLLAARFCPHLLTPTSHIRMNAGVGARSSSSSHLS